VLRRVALGKHEASPFAYCRRQSDVITCCRMGICDILSHHAQFPLHVPYVSLMSPNITLKSPVSLCRSILGPHLGPYLTLSYNTYMYNFFFKVRGGKVRGVRGA
jgi:hypothetical protein